MAIAEGLVVLLIILGVVRLFMGPRRRSSHSTWKCLKCNGTGFVTYRPPGGDPATDKRQMCRTCGGKGGG